MNDVIRDGQVFDPEAALALIRERVESPDWWVVLVHDRASYQFISGLWKRWYEPKVMDDPRQSSIFGFLDFQHYGTIVLLHRGVCSIPEMATYFQEWQTSIGARPLDKDRFERNVIAHPEWIMVPHGDGQKASARTLALGIIWETLIGGAEGR